MDQQHLHPAWKPGHTFAEAATAQGFAGGAAARTITGRFTRQLDCELAEGKITQEQYEKRRNR